MAVIELLLEFFPPAALSPAFKVGWLFCNPEDSFGRLAPGCKKARAATEMELKAEYGRLTNLLLPSPDKVQPH